MSTTTSVRSPAIVGVAQTIDRPGEHELGEAPGPIELIVTAARAAATDAGSPSLLERVDWIGATGGLFRYRDPAAAVAAQLGCPGARTAVTAITGTAPQDLVAAACGRIASGELDVALVVGGEARWTAQRTKQTGVARSWEEPSGEAAGESFSVPEEMFADLAVVGPPTVSYALFEDALRLRAGRTVGEQREHCARLWARFSAVAEDNPFAWDRSHHTAAGIRDVSPTNRMIAYPYTKAMVANNTVNMASALLIASPDAARSAGVHADQMVYPLVVTSAHETWEVLRRRELASTPALAAAGRVALEQTGLDFDDIDHVDLYACFPSIVQMSCAALGLDEDRKLTQTGGLGFAGAAIANSVGHSIAATVERVRTGGRGLVHGNGGSATKQSFGIYSPTPERAFVSIDCQDAVDLGERDLLPTEFEGSVTVDAATVRHDREGPSDILAVVRAADGRRACATSSDPGLIGVVESDGIAGRDARRRADGTLEL